MRRTSRIIATVCVLAFAIGARAAELHVPDDYNTIQAAIDAASDGDTVIVADGTYTGEGNRDIDFLGKAITVRSESGPENCIIDCNGQRVHSALRLHSGEGGDSILDGFTVTGVRAGVIGESRAAIYLRASSPTITNCIISGNHAFGIECGDNSSPTISNCTITQNLSWIDDGFDVVRVGGIAAYNSSPAISNCIITQNEGYGIYCRSRGASEVSPNIINCTISDNVSEYGAGIYCTGQGNPIISDCIISGNWAARYGGGIYCTDETQLTIANCTISRNRAGLGGAVCSKRTRIAVTNCIITDNTAYRDTGGILCSGGTITNCTIANNTAYRDTGGVSCRDEELIISNCTITGNTAAERGGAIKADSNLIIANSIVWGNKDQENHQIYLLYSDEARVSYSNIEAGEDGVYVREPATLHWGPGNMDEDPCFVDPGYWADANDPNVIIGPNDPNAVWVDGDYHLLPTSPCIDTGDPNYIPEPNETDLDGNPRVSGDAIDMGAYEYIPPIVAQVRISSSSLNPQSKGRWVSCYIVLPEDYNVGDIDPNSILLEDEIAPDRVVSYGRLAVAKFSRAAVQELLSELQTPGEVELLVSGQLTDGTIFEGTDTIRIVGRERKRILRRRIGR